MTDTSGNKDLMLADIYFRDYLATEAMNGLLANHQIYPMGMSFKPDSLAEAAYRMADAMLRAREK
ncbi:hypothetical protein [Morganella morganii]|uniref:hypothetical protein n=1 Tax=Morganella morganii TaxID=582 RepID=UPI00280751DB|nr:hypothetical protein SUGSMm_09100 [Morganella morganii subsp. sibonii]HDU8307928.1 hypothetical protein [Morganella morganii subsp. sibonii]